MIIADSCHQLVFASHPQTVKYLEMNLAGQAKTQLTMIPINNAHWQYHSGFVAKSRKRDNAV
jgi:hypothetical protein